MVFVVLGIWGLGEGERGEREDQKSVEYRIKVEKSVFRVIFI